MLFLCTDLDRTLLPNGDFPESKNARPLFSRLAGMDSVTLAYVTGRDLHRVLDCMAQYGLPEPDYILADVGSSIYLNEAGGWCQYPEWRTCIAADWQDGSRSKMVDALRGVEGIRLQEDDRQSDWKLSWYVATHKSQQALVEEVTERLGVLGVRTRLIYSVDEQKGVGLLDILPERASKRHAVEFLMKRTGHGYDTTLFAGDSGNDMEVFDSPVPSVVVANAHAHVKQQLLHNLKERGVGKDVYFATGGFLGMNGNYGAGILEGVNHFHPLLMRQMMAGGENFDILYEASR